jgi:hypothetical protein
MAKTRISISLDAEQAERIRAHAERAGMDVSAYLVSAAVRQMTETDAMDARFASIDAVIEAAEREAHELPPPGELGGDALTEQERREVEEAMALVYGPGEAPTEAPTGDTTRARRGRRGDAA